MINGVTQLVLTKVDVLNIFDSFKYASHYVNPDGSMTKDLPFDLVMIVRLLSSKKLKDGKRA